MDGNSISYRRVHRPLARLYSLGAKVMELTWFGIIKLLTILTLLIILGWFVYINEVCMGIFFILLGIIGLFWAKNYLEEQFGPDHA